jgi:hypothetical protein
VRAGFRSPNPSPRRRPRSGWALPWLLLAGSVLAGSCLNPQPDPFPQAAPESTAPPTDANRQSTGPRANLNEQPQSPGSTPEQRPAADMSATPPSALEPAPEPPALVDPNADAGAPPADAGLPDAATPANAL